MVAQRNPYEFPAVRAFATELTAWRDEAGLSKTEFAEALGYTPQLIGQLESAKNIPSKKFSEDVDTFFKTNGLYLRLWKAGQSSSWRGPRRDADRMWAMSTTRRHRPPQDRVDRGHTAVLDEELLAAARKCAPTCASE